MRLRRLLLPAALALTASAAAAQTYRPDWESLDRRPVPQWFRDAKFGIFIHWGVYAVPGWSPKGSYAEWYQYGLQNGDSARIRYHRARFGARSYYDLAADFTAELFDPDEWASLFERSGARYIVLTSKHHDGFTLWPSAEADRSWGFPWNAGAIGPRRDLVGDLFRAVRKTSVHAGMYYSLYEWFNPLWKKDPVQFAAQHTWPQMKALITTYQPDVFWTDGDWEVPPETWKSREFLTWLYNESPVKDRVVVNDRWGSGVRFTHGGVYTPEYQPDLEFEDHDWEESRGMGFSYGYNRAEDAWDYNSSQSLVLQLVDKVSRGGNFLLDIGPDAHGKIPPIMQERLLQIGAWLRVNGEAIYGASRWKAASQWSEGRRDYKPTSGSGDLLLKLTVAPDSGYAVKEVFYTYNAERNDLYAIVPKYPSSRVVLLRDIRLPENTPLTFLATGERLQWRQQGNDVEVELPPYDPGRIDAPYAYVIRLRGFGAFAARPSIRVSYLAGELRPQVSLAALRADAIRYTTDGSDPGPASRQYAGPFMLDTSASVRAKAWQGERVPSAVNTQPAVRYHWQPAVRAGSVAPGLSYAYYEPEGTIDLGFEAGTPKATGVVEAVSLARKLRKDKFALRFTGYLRVDRDGLYRFFTESDDGSRLFVDGVEVVNNDGNHGPVEREGRAALRRGLHTIRVVYFDSGGDNALKVSMQAEGGKKIELPATRLFH